MTERRQIPWGRLAAESVLIVVSILVAFAIDAWWQGRIEGIEEDQLLTAIERDMTDNLAELERVETSYAAGTIAFQAFLASSPEDLAALPADSARMMFNAFATVVTFTPFEGAFATADLGLIQDPAIRGAIGSWRGHVSDVLEDQPVMTGMLLDALRSLGPSGGVDAMGAQIGALEPGTAPPFSDVLSNLREDEQAVAALKLLRVLINVVSADLAEVRDATDTLIAHLEARHE